MGYDLQYRITSIQTGTVQDVLYAHDANGNITAITNNLDPTKNKTFSYDPLDQLAGATGPWGTLAWTYDPVGNRLSYADSSGTTTYSYEPSTSWLTSLSGASSSSFTYDANGNTATEDARQYVYNQNNRLTQVTDGASLGDYMYNAEGERVAKTVQATTTVFHYDAQGSLLAETLPDGSAVDYLYLHGQAVAKATAVEVLYIHVDHLGTPLVMTDSLAAAVWEIEARPFGDQPTINGTASLNLRFRGQYHDDESGMSYNYFRDYDSSLGRYIEPDPIGLFGGLGYYSYARSNPIVFNDPKGLQPGDKRDRKGKNKKDRKAADKKDPKDLPRVYNYCGVNDPPVFWNDTDFNPYIEKKKWREFRDHFIDQCDAAQQAPGTLYPVCRRVVGMDGTTGICVCCKSCQKPSPS